MESTGSKSKPQWGRPLVPYFMSDTLEINEGLEITKKEEESQKKLIIPRGKGKTRVRSFSNGYFVDGKEVEGLSKHENIQNIEKGARKQQRKNVVHEKEIYADKGINVVEMKLRNRMLITPLDLINGATDDKVHVNKPTTAKKNTTKSKKQPQTPAPSGNFLTNMSSPITEEQLLSSLLESNSGNFAGGQWSNSPSPGALPDPKHHF